MIYSHTRLVVSPGNALSITKFSMNANQPNKISNFATKKCGGKALRLSKTASKEAEVVGGLTSQANLIEAAAAG